MSAVTVTVKQEIHIQRLVDLLVTAFDGNMTGQWAQADVYMPDEPDWSWSPDPSYWDGIRKIYVAAACGGHVDIIDMEDDEKRHRLDLDALRKGIQIMAEKCPRHFADFMNQNDDSITGDVFVQCCIFGEIIYG